LEAEAAGDAVVQQCGVIILELHDTITVEADEVVMLRLIQKVWIVKGLITTEIDLSKQVAVHKKLKRAINGGA
jgi:hypothetical protein